MSNELKNKRKTIKAIKSIKKLCRVTDCDKCILRIYENGKFNCFLRENVSMPIHWNINKLEENNE